MKIYGIILAVVVGVCISLQAPINTGLGKVISPKTAALHSFMTGTIILLLLSIRDGSIRMYPNITSIHPVYWVGGFLGVGIVFFTIKVIPILGTGAAFSIFVTIQLITGMLVDHFGVLGVPRSPISSTKILGVLLMLVGVSVIVRS